MQSLLKSINSALVKEAYESSTTDNLSTIISKALSPSKGTTRVIIKMSLGDLKKFYLKHSGAEEYVASMTDAEILLVPSWLEKTPPESAEIAIANMTSLGTQLKSGITAEVAVLLDVPVGDLVAFSRVDPTNISGIRTALTKILSYSNYKMSIFIAKCRKADAIIYGVDENEENFNPVCVANYPSKKMLYDANEEWQDSFGRHKAEQNAQDKLDAQNEKAGPVDSEIKNVVISAMITKSISNTTEFVKEISSILKQKHTRAEVVSVLNAMQSAHPVHDAFKKIADAVLSDKVTHWKDEQN
jgi:hypothetical protein